MPLDAPSGSASIRSTHQPDGQIETLVLDRDVDDVQSSETYAFDDYLNRMISRTVDADGAGTTHSPATEYSVYDHDASNNWALKDSSTSKEGTIPFGANPATDAGQIVLQLDESGVPTHRYLWGPAVDMLLADEAVDDGGAEDVAWTLTDHQNSVRDFLVYDEVADQWIIENHITYRAFGEKAAETGAVDCVFGFTGRYLDSLTGDQYNHQRWYKPATGNWQSEDPIGFEGGDANLYRYCGNDPVNRVDPCGLDYRDTTERLKEAMILAELAAGAYSNNAAAQCKGWTNYVLANDSDDGFRAVLFKNLQTGKYVLVFAGTQDLRDWIANVKQGTGFKASQYEKAIQLAKEQIAAHGKDNIQLVGHSLGGGLAATAALVNKVKATTFNPAGVHSATLKRHGETKDDQWNLITTYRVRCEILTTLQDSKGFIGIMMPDTNGLLYSLLGSVTDPVTLHGMDEVQRSLRKAYHDAIKPTLRQRWERAMNQIFDWQNWYNGGRGW